MSTKSYNELYRQNILYKERNDILNRQNIIYNERNESLEEENIIIT